MTSTRLSRMQAEVISARPDGCGELITVSVPAAGPTPGRAGQHVLLGPEPTGAVVLPESWWLAGWAHHEVHGITWQLASPQLGWRPHDRLEVTGPIGRAFTPPTEPVRALVIGHESGQAPARWWAAALRERGCTVTLALLAADADRHRDLAATRRVAQQVVVVETDPAAPTTQLRALIADAAPDVVYAAGPPEMTLPIAAAATAAGIASQVTAWAPGSDGGCGIGLCHDCTVMVRDGSRWRAVRPCLVGPVLPGAALSGGGAR